MKKILLNIYKYTFGKIKNKMIKDKNITIISNNCWGGIFYRNHNLRYLSPTLGMFFIGDEYIKFIYNMKKYINSSNLEFIDISESKYCDYLRKIKYKGFVGKIEDCEICFLHYKNQNEAKEKWNRRKARINWNNILYKFNDQNLCTYENLKAFNNFKADKKLCFTAKHYEEFETVQLKKYEKYEFVLDDIKSYKKYCNIYKKLGL